MHMNLVRVLVNLFQFNRTNWKAVILCLLAAAIFWLFNAFNKSHTYTVRFPLRFEYDHQRFVAIKPLPHQISINVTGTGWDLIRKTLKVEIPPLVVPVERPLETKKIPTGSLTAILVAQLGNLKFNFFATDTLRIMLDERISRTFRLSADVSEVVFREGYGIVGAVEVSPDTVQLDGPKSILKTLPDIIPVPVKASGISKTFQEEVEVPLFNSESVNRNPAVVMVSVEVGPLETLEAMIKVKTVNQPSRWKAVITDSVKISLRIPADQIEDTRNALQQVRAILDLKGARNETFRAYPTIVGLPIYAQVISIDSISLKVDERK